MKDQLFATTEEVLCQQNCIYTQETFSGGQNLILHFILLFCWWFLFCSFSGLYICPVLSIFFFLVVLLLYLSWCFSLYFSFYFKKKKQLFPNPFMLHKRKISIQKRLPHKHKSHIFHYTRNITLRSQVTFSLETHK